MKKGDKFTYRYNEGKSFINLVCMTNKKINLDDGRCRCDECGRLLKNGYEFAIEDSEDDLYYFGGECIKKLEKG